MEEEKATFSYTVLRSWKRQENNLWTAIEKGHDKSDKYEISYRAIRYAARQIKGYILETPCHMSEIFQESGYKIYLKKELHQFTDSIKARGVIYTLLQLSDEHKRKGVIAISTGNFGFILCHYGYKFRIPVTVVVPLNSANETIELCKQFSNSQIITVFFVGRNMLEAHQIALHIARTEGLFYLDGNNHPNMIIGQATLGLEIIQQQPEIDTVLLPTTIDGCALTIGIAIVLKRLNPNIKVIEVQCHGIDCLFQDVIQRTDLITELEIPAKEYVVCSIKDLPCMLDQVFCVHPLVTCLAYNHLNDTYCYRDNYGAIALALILSDLCRELKGERMVIPFFGRMDSTVDLLKQNL